MLLVNKIQELIDGKVSIYDIDLTSIINELSNKGTVDSTVMLQIELLFHTLEQKFPLDYLNLELYKKLQHLIESTRDYILNNVITETPTPEVVVIPAIVVIPDILTFTPIRVNEISAVQAITVQLINLTAPLVITGDSAFEISLSPTIRFSTSLYLLPNETKPTETYTIYVRFKPTTLGSFDKNIIFSSSEVISYSVNVLGECIETVMVIGTTDINFGNVNVNHSSTVTSVQLNANYLIENILIASDNPLYKLSITEGGTYTDTLTLVADAWPVNKLIYIKFTPTSSGTSNSIITFSTGDITRTLTTNGNGVLAFVSIQPIALGFAGLQIGLTSDLQYNIIGEYLLDDVVITCPTGYLVSTTVGVFSSSAITVPKADLITTKVIYVRFAPVNKITYNGNITHSTLESNDPTLSLTGYGMEASITTSVPTIDFGTGGVDLPSVLSYTVSGLDLLEDITVNTFDSHYTLSLNNTLFTPSIVIPRVSGVVATTTVYVKFIPTTAMLYTDSITHTSSPATTKIVSVSGTGAILSDINITPSSLNFGTVLVGSSNTLTYSVSGTYLTDDLVISTTLGYTVSLDNITFYPSLSITPTEAGTVPSTLIYTKFSPITGVTYGSIISNASTNATQMDVSVTGVGALVETFLTPGVFAWICPTGVTSIQIEAIGGGGAGAGKTNPGDGFAGAGGAGGSYAKKNSFTTIPGQSYQFVVAASRLGVAGDAANGTNSYFNNLSSVAVCSAIGGASGVGEVTAGVGSTIGSIGDVLRSGGNGSLPTIGYTGAGGGSAGSSSIGGNALNPNGGASGGGLAGAGANSRTAGVFAINGVAGSNVGGGGSGGFIPLTEVAYGGNGASGVIVITYIII